MTSPQSSSTESSTSNVAQNRKNLSKMLQLHGYSACREALVLLEDHYTSSTKYETIEEFISEVNKVITFETEANSSIIDPDLADLVVKKLCKKNKQQVSDTQQDDTVNLEQEEEEARLPENLLVKVKNVQYESPNNKSVTSDKQTNEFNIHYNFIFKRLNTLPIFQGDFQLMKLSTLTASTQLSIRCICFGLLVKDVTKIDGYMLIDSTGRVPIRITPDTTFRNRLAYSNCIVLVEGVYMNPDDILFAANIGLPPVLLDPLADKSIACADEKLVIILRELYLDDEDICNSLDMLFTGYNSMENPPILFILIGDFTRHPCETSVYRKHMKKLIRILRTCDNLKDSHFVFVPGTSDTSPQTGREATAGDVVSRTSSTLPKAPLTTEQLQLNLLHMSNFDNVHLATNPTHVYLGERLITVVAHSYLKELRKNLLHDMSDHRNELFDTCKQIILSNAHLLAGVTKTYHSSMNLWHKPDLLVLVDTEAFGNRYDYSSSSRTDTSFTTVPSFSRQSYQFKVYYVKSGELEDSQVSSDALHEIEVLDEDGEVVDENEYQEEVV